MKKELNVLVGSEVAVHPLLTVDPIGCQGQIGKVLKADENVITVIFNNEKIGNYIPDGLLTLLPKDAILIDLVATNNVISPQDCKLALHICALLSEKKYSEALRTAIANDTLRTLCTINCDAWINRRRKKDNKIIIKARM